MSLHNQTDEACATAFGAGSDARLSGLPIGVNPYTNDPPLSRTWRRGWMHAQKYWGADARGPRKLPPVRGTA